MTPAQRISFYFPAWHKCATANGWLMRGGRLIADLQAQLVERIPDPAGEERRRVIQQALSLADKMYIAATAEHLRHGCNLLVSKGRTVHTAAMDNRATTLAVRLFNLLSDPDDLTAVMRWLNPDRADHDEYADWMGTIIPEGTLIAIARNAWNTADWRSQTLDQLRWLRRTATAGQQRRQEARNRAIALHIYP